MYSDIILEKDALYILWYHAFFIYVDQKNFKLLKSPSPPGFFFQNFYISPQKDALISQIIH